MQVDSLFPGIALKGKEGFYVGILPTTRADSPKWISVQSNMGWWSDFYPGENEVIVYLGETRGAAGRLLREVLWRGEVAYIRPYDWRNLEILKS